MLLNLMRQYVQKLGVDVHRLELDDSPIIEAKKTFISRMQRYPETSFLIADPEDTIQEHLARGVFYEQDILDSIASYVPSGSTVIDIGANVGNHAIYFARHLNAGRVVAFEPMRFQHAILSINIVLNDLNETVDVHKLALSDKPGLVRMITPNRKNLGRSIISDGSVYGEWVRIARGDDILGTQKIGILKIDVEGHEMHTLRGLKESIKRSRPVILIEVNNANLDTFNEWAEECKYYIANRFCHYVENTEFLMLPKEYK